MTIEILVTGATGNIGGEIIKALATQAIPARAMVRNPAKAAKLDGIELVEGDFDNPTALNTALTGIKRAFLILPDSSEAERLGQNFLEAATQVGLEQIVYLSMWGAEENTAISFAKIHWQTEQQIKANRVGYTFLQPNLFMQNFLRQAPGIVAQGSVSLPMNEGKVSIVDIRDIAATAAGLLVNGGYKNETVIITGSESLTYPEATRQIGEIIGKEITYNVLSFETAKESYLKFGMNPTYVNDLIELYRLFDSGYGQAVTDVVEKIGKKKPYTFKQFVQDHLQAFKGD
jgi:uncharacterized protein YbjT (DUF2867 family)